MSFKSITKQRNPLVADLAVAFCIIWNFKLGLKGGGTLVRIIKRLFPKIRRYHLDYPGFGLCNISFLDFCWLRQAYRGLNEERALLERIQSLMPHFPVVWDIGANSGYLAAELILRLNPDKLILFEPNPEHQESLQSIAALDSRIQVFMNGLSDCSGTAVLHIPGEVGSGSSCASINRELLGSCEQLHSVIVTLESGDSLVDSGVVTPPSLIVLDVEGHEESVISGLSKTIENCQPIIVLEHIFLSDDVMIRLIPRAYRAYTICDSSGELIAGLNKNRGHNLLLLPARIHNHTHA